MTKDKSLHLTDKQLGLSDNPMIKGGALDSDAGETTVEADMLAALKLCAEYLGSLPPGNTREPLYLAYSAAIDAIEKAERN